eukprot:8322756-Alexandrium_andersonii.AAC.1
MARELRLVGGRGPGPSVGQEPWLDRARPAALGGRRLADQGCRTRACRRDHALCPRASSDGNALCHRAGRRLVPESVR